MAESKTLNLKIAADLDGLASSMLDQFADQLEEAASGCRAQAAEIRGRKGEPDDPH